MKLKHWHTHLLFIIVVLCLSSAAALAPKPTPANKDAIILQKMLDALEQFHFAPQTLDQTFSKKIYKLYIDRLDGGRRFLTQPDLSQLQVFEISLGDAVKNQDFSFYALSQKLLDAGIAKAENYCNDALSGAIDFSADEKIIIDSDKNIFAKDDAALKEAWRKIIKYDVEIHLANLLEDKIAGQPDARNKLFEDLKAEALAQTTKSFKDYFKRLKNTKPNNRFIVYLNAIANVYDPHTAYFEPIGKQNYDIGMAGRLIGIGARLQTDWETGFTKVTDIVIGGPAHKQGELKTDDLVMRIAQSDKDAVDIAGMSIEEVSTLVRGEIGKEIRLTVKSKTSGMIKTIPIVRDEIIVDEGFISSAIIKTEKNGERIGYIRLPKFYADFEREGGRRCAEDMEQEIEKLKQVNVKGIVIDLRDNLGGSLPDVVKMTGQFIESGPIVQVKNRFDRPDVLSDTDPMMQYDGPLIILQNEFSASASEIMAAALQDYGRAIIVGTNSYGKGTVQRFYDLDRSLAGNSEMKPLGQIKMSVQKFFRITGNATQLHGVTPDIFLPDNYMYIPSGENDTEYPFPWSQIKSVAFSQQVADMQKTLPALAENSKKRVAANPVFKMITENAQFIKQQRERPEETLNIAAYIATNKKQQAYAKKLNHYIKTNEQTDDTGDKKISGERLWAENLLVDADKLAATADSSKILRNNDRLQNLRNDIRLQEILFIMRDLIRTGIFKNVLSESGKK